MEIEGDKLHACVENRDQNEALQLESDEDIRTVSQRSRADW